MKNTCCQCGISFSLFENINEVFHCSATARRNYGNRQTNGKILGNVQSKAFPGSIIIHRGKQNFPGSAVNRFLCPLIAFCLGFCSSAVKINIPLAIVFLLGVILQTLRTKTEVWKSWQVFMIFRGLNARNLMDVETKGRLVDMEYHAKRVYVKLKGSDLDREDKRLFNVA